MFYGGEPHLSLIMFLSLWSGLLVHPQAALAPPGVPSLF